MKDEKLFKIVQKIYRNINIPDLHSFTAQCKDCKVFVEARKEANDIFIKEYHNNGPESEFCGNPMQVTNRLDMLGIDLNTIDM